MVGARASTCFPIRRPLQRARVTDQRLLVQYAWALRRIRRYRDIRSSVLRVDKSA